MVQKNVLKKWEAPQCKFQIKWCQVIESKQASKQVLYHLQSSLLYNHFAPVSSTTPPNKCCSCYTPTHPLSAFRSGISRCQCLETTLFSDVVSRDMQFSMQLIYIACRSKLLLVRRHYYVALR